MPRITRTIEFIETSVFTRQIRAMATDDDLRKLQLELIADPAKGDMISGTGGLRKVRMAQGKGGKSGGARVIYFLANEETIYLVFAFRKNNKATLSDTEKSQLRALTQQLRREV